MNEFKKWFSIYIIDHLALDSKYDSTTTSEYPAEMAQPHLYAKTIWIPLQG